MPASSQGHQAEGRARDGAGLLGVPDFVYTPEQQKKGPGSREVGDGLLVAGQAGLIMQSKSRHAAEAIDDNPAKAERWCRKHARRAQRQAAGTRRTIQRGGVQATSLRGYRRILPESAKWPAVVIIDHPHVPAVEFDTSADTMFITLEDWLLLQYLVRSTAGIIQYVERVLESSISVALGGEMHRFAAMATADLDACATLTSFPTLSMQKLSEEEMFCVSLVDQLVDHVADPTNRGFHPEHYLEIVEQLDRIPIIGRARLGSKMKRTVIDVAEDGMPRTFMIVDGILGPGRDGSRLAFIYNRFDFLNHGIAAEYFKAEVASYAVTRQLQALHHGAGTDTGTLVVGVLMHRKFGLRYAFCFVSGTPDIPADIAADFEAKYGIFDGQSIR